MSSGKTRVIHERFFYSYMLFLFLLQFQNSQILVTSALHLRASAASCQPIEEAATRDRRRRDQLRLDQCLDYATKGIGVDVHVPQQHGVLHLSMSIVAQIPERLLPQRVELVVVTFLDRR